MCFIFLVEDSSEFLGAVDKSPVILDDYDEGTLEMKTKLHNVINIPHYTYTRTQWKLNIRKEVKKYLHKKDFAVNFQIILSKFVCDIKFRGYSSAKK